MYNEDDIFNYSKRGDDTQDINYINKKQLINLENDKSLSISSDYDNLSNRSSIRPYNNKPQNNLKINDKNLLENEINFDGKFGNRLNMINSPIENTRKERIIGKNEELLKFISDNSGKITNKIS